MSNVNQRRPSPADRIPPHGLWSLWDMQSLYAPGLIELAKEIGRITSQLKGVDEAIIIEEPARRGNKEVMADHAKTFQALGFQMCAMKAEELVANLDSDMTRGEYKQALHELYGRMCDESKLFCIISLDAQETGLYEPEAPLFGEDFEAKFPSGAYELDEATKCMALGRSTAAVFHFMRIMEIAIRAVARSLGISDPVKPAERNWGAILKAIWDGIETKWPTATSRMHGDGHTFESIYASFDAVKNPWRNATMHVENKYTGEEASHIFAAVRGLMRNLALRMDENGEPKA
jgi:hypothetical protein